MHKQLKQQLQMTPMKMDDKLKDLIRLREVVHLKSFDGKLVRGSLQLTLFYLLFEGRRPSNAQLPSLTSESRHHGSDMPAESRKLVNVISKCACTEGPGSIFKP